MRITRRQLRRIIREAVTPFPKGDRLKQLLDALRQEFMSNYDQGDPSMTGLGFEAWVDQVSNAINYVKGEVGGDLSKFEHAQQEAYDMLMDGDFSPMNHYGKMARASDVQDLDDEFDLYLDNLESGDITELPHDDDM